MHTIGLLLVFCIAIVFGVVNVPKGSFHEGPSTLGSVKMMQWDDAVAAATSRKFNVKKGANFKIPHVPKVKRQVSNEFCWFLFQGSGTPSDTVTMYYPSDGTGVGNCTTGPNGIASPSSYAIQVTGTVFNVLVKCELSNPTTNSPCGVTFGIPTVDPSATWTAAGYSEGCADPGAILQVLDQDANEDCHGDCSCVADPTGQHRYFWNLGLIGGAGGATNSDSCDCRETCDAETQFPCDAAFGATALWPAYNRLFIENNATSTERCSAFATFRSNVDSPGLWTSVEVFANGVSMAHCTNTFVASSICNGIGNAALPVFNQLCDGFYWDLNNPGAACDNSIEPSLTVGTNSSTTVCGCGGSDFVFSMRPCITTDQWGSSNEGACGAPTQILSIVCGVVFFQ